MNARAVLRWLTAVERATDGVDDPRMAALLLAGSDRMLTYYVWDLVVLEMRG